ncbi:MAG: recombinase family protein [Eubacteriales bacterium]
MAQNRVIPFGYCMVKGEYIIHQEEQEVVLKIFTQYAEGVSYKLIAEELTLAQFPYIPEKITWNKNMVARILQNEQYRGQDKYPRLVSEEQWESSKQAMKPYTKTVSPEIKLLKPLMICGVCGGGVERKLTPQGKERWRCVKDVKHISVTCTDQSILEQVKKMQWETQKHSPKDYKNKTISMEIVAMEKKLAENKELSSEERNGLLHTIAQMKYQLCDRQANTTDKPLQEWLGNIEKIVLKENKIKEIVTKDGNIIRNEE